MQAFGEVRKRRGLLQVPRAVVSPAARLSSMQKVCTLLRSGSRPRLGTSYQAGLRTGNGYSMISMSSSSFDGRDKSGTRFGRA